MARHAPGHLRVAVLGAGRIGLRIAGRLDGGPEGPELVALLARPEQRAALAARFGAARICTRLEEVLARAPDVAAECASARLLAEAGPALLRAGTDVIPLSLAAFANPATERALLAAAGAGPGRLEIPAGAMAAIGFLAAAREEGLHAVRLCVSYPPTRLAGTPAEPALAGLAAPRTVFAGTVREAAALFPRHLNVSVGVALAGLGLDRTELALVADPGIGQCRFVLSARAAPGDIHLAVEGRDRPVEEDPVDHTTFSVIHLLRRRMARLAV
ncbi:DUF108 domain-containing protein [Roseomonas sp. OT10]|uniref:aspartate dehydrogenase domain-containing protein n=1 Tax=Roseomonas cutis TaxID=2897332 RepID=UPI001E3AACE5|nr:aspartate dehydrogenase domain-containing protein [Roseomonas sp. OT10]UFN49285.1 DUF108 domain-containing protein [Roseomonas sp. OT10]